MNALWENAWVFLAGASSMVGLWVCNKLLDITAGPYLSDMWAKLSRKRSIKQAENLRATYVFEVKRVKDTRLLVLSQIFQVQTMLVVTAAYVLIGVHMSGVFRPSTFGAVDDHLARFFPIYASAIFLAFLLRYKARSRSLIRHIQHPEKRLNDLQKRIIDLLIAGGMDAPGREQFMAEVYELAKQVVPSAPDTDSKVCKAPPAPAAETTMRVEPLFTTKRNALMPSEIFEQSITR